MRVARRLSLAVSDKGLSSSAAVPLYEVGAANVLAIHRSTLRFHDVSATDEIGELGGTGCVLTFSVLVWGRMHSCSSGVRSELVWGLG
jgi:hypothetical protein